MRKSLQAILFICLFNVGGIYAQSLELTLKEDTVQFGDFSGEYIGKIYVTNTSASAKRVLVKRSNNLPAEDHKAYFCWVLCYSENVDVSPDTLTIEPGDTTKLFKGYIYPDKNEDEIYTNGVSEARFCFYDADNISDSVCHTMVWNIQDFETSISPKQKLNFTIHPSLAENSITIMADYNSKAQFEIISTTGRSILEGKMEKGSEIDVSHLSSGMYFIRVNTEDNRLGVKRFYKR